MSEIRRMPFFSHLRAQPTSHVLRYKKGRLVSSSPGSSFWFRPMTTTIADVPVDDREQAFLFTGRTADFQDVAVQGTITFRVVDPELAARRIDFGIDVAAGTYVDEPLERLSQLVSQNAQQLALDWISHRNLEAVLREAVQDLRPLMASELIADSSLTDLGLEVAAVRLTRVAPNPEIEKALQAPAREHIQQAADEAMFQRRALAVEKERAIAENELANQVELERRREQLIAQEGSNQERQAQDTARAKRIEAESQAERAKLGAAAQADGIRHVETAQIEAEQQRIDIYRELPSHILLGLAARDLAGKLERIDHLNLSPDTLGGLLQSMMTAGTRKLEA